MKITENLSWFSVPEHTGFALQMSQPFAQRKCIREGSCEKMGNKVYAPYKGKEEVHMEQLRWYRNGRHVKLPFFENYNKREYIPQHKFNFLPLSVLTKEMTQVESGLGIIDLKENSIDKDDDVYC